MVKGCRRAYWRGFEHTYDDGADGNVAQYLRLVGMEYPTSNSLGTTEVGYTYDGDGGIDNALSRVTAITVGGIPVVQYTYLGASTVASVDYPQVEVSLDYAANNFEAWDQFGRVVTQQWTGSSGQTLDEYQYTYDADGNVTSKTNVTETGGSLDEAYTYDNLGRLISATCGSNTPQTWTLDSLGNDLSTGSYNAANEETPDTGSSGYDLAGNMTTLPSGDTAVYDAWGRLVEVDSGTTVVEQYTYDGLGRRIQTITYTDGTPSTQDYYLSQSNQVLLDAVNGGGSGDMIYVWGTRGLNDLVAYTTATDTYYALQDANGNITGLVDTASDGVVERYYYSPYGSVTVCDPSWTPVSQNQNQNVSQYGNTVLFAGMELDPTTGLYYDRARWYSTVTDTFITQDPAQADANLYRYCGNDPTGAIDPTGLDTEAPGAPRSTRFSHDGFSGEVGYSTSDQFEVPEMQRVYNATPGSAGHVQLAATNLAKPAAASGCFHWVQTFRTLAYATYWDPGVTLFCLSTPSVKFLTGVAIPAPEDDYIHANTLTSKLYLDTGSYDQPYYDLYGRVRRGPNSIVIADSPSDENAMKDLFSAARTSVPTGADLLRVTSTTMFNSYLVFVPKSGNTKFLAKIAWSATYWKDATGGAYNSFFGSPAACKSVPANEASTVMGLINANKRPAGR
jgi:RHS repeat-associated protein